VNSVEWLLHSNSQLLEYQPAFVSVGHSLLPSYDKMSFALVLFVVAAAADRFETSKGSFHLVVKRMSSALAGIMPEVMKWPNTQADFIKTSREFSEKSVSERCRCN
jgi:hypothetical protein